MVIYYWASFFSINTSFFTPGDKKATSVAMSNGKVVVNEELKQELEEAAQDTSKGYQQIRQTGAVAGVGATVDSDPSACSECHFIFININITMT